MCHDVVNLRLSFISIVVSSWVNASKCVISTTELYHIQFSCRHLPEVNKTIPFSSFTPLLLRQSDFLMTRRFTSPPLLIAQTNLQSSYVNRRQRPACAGGSKREPNQINCTDAKLVFSFLLQMRQGTTPTIIWLKFKICCMAPLVGLCL